jgi:integrase
VRYSAKAFLVAVLFRRLLGAVLKMKVGNCRAAAARERRRAHYRLAVHHVARTALDAYLALAGIAGDPDAPLWQSAPRRGGKLSGRGLTEGAALLIVKRRCGAANLPGDICNHSFRATGITLHQAAGATSRRPGRSPATLRSRPRSFTTAPATKRTAPRWSGCSFDRRA